MDRVPWRPLIGSVAAKVHEVIFRLVRRFPAQKTVSLSAVPMVSVVCVTNRPAKLDDVIAAFDAQDYGARELILVTNGPGFGTDVLDRLAERSDVSVMATPATVTLGAALNAAADIARGEIVAKIDDDDRYGPRYLSHGVESMRRTRAGVVGQKSYYVYLTWLDETRLMFPGNGEKRVGRVAGGSIFAHRDVLAQIRYPDVDLGEDTRFVRSVERRGFMVWGETPGDHLVVRQQTGHTWQPSIDELRASSTEIGPGSTPHLWHRR